MIEKDTIRLLRECDAGTKTAVNSIREVLDNVKSEELLPVYLRLSQAERELKLKKEQGK